MPDDPPETLAACFWCDVMVPAGQPIAHRPDCRYVGQEQLVNIQRVRMSKKKPDASPPAAGEPNVPEHRRCPICWGTRQGAGTAYSTQRSKTYYKCVACSHTWTVKVTHRETTIEHRTVELQNRQDETVRE